MDFETRLKRLQSMIGQEEEMELFASSYAELLREVKTGPGPRYEKFAEMKGLLLRQAQYLMTEWIREKAINKIGRVEPTRRMN
jgi:hypothetical protein